MNTKRALIFTSVAIILTFSSIILIQKTQAKETININSYTKAICNQTNFCQDYIIECEDKQIKKISPLTGAFVQFDKNWKDPRSKEEINKEC